MSEHSTAIAKIIRLARRFKGPVKGMSQVGEKYDPKKFRKQERSKEK